LVKLKLFLSLSTKTKLLYLEAYFFLGWARLIKCFPFSKVAPLLGEQMDETAYTYSDNSLKFIRPVSHAINVMSGYTFWESKCLVKAIAGMKMLERRNIESTLYLGTGKDEIGKFIAHAWLRSGPFYVTGSEGKEKFTVINKFAKKTKK
jgi:hypothetical protein